MHLLLRLLAATVALGVLAPAAAAAPPPNDSPAAPAVFEPFSARAGVPVERHAVADLAEATPDAGVVPCLGPGSFARTAWYRIDPSAALREIMIEASGRTTELVDLAAYVQPLNGAVQTSRANRCAGEGVEGADAAEDGTTGLGLRVPPNQAVLIQVGRRGATRNPADEQVQLEVVETAISGVAPKGDRADSTAPLVRLLGFSTVRLSGTTTSEEDVATPGCPARASAWRRFRPRKTERLTFIAEGAHAASLAVFRGSKPSRNGFSGCVDRAGDGPLVLPVKVRRKRLTWIRVGTDRPATGASARVGIRHAVRGDRVEGGGCLGKLRSRLSGSLASRPARAKALNKVRVLQLRLKVARGPLCGPRLRLIGPRGRTYARVDLHSVRGAGQLVALRRTRKLVRGSYRVRTDAYGLARVRYRVPSSVSFTLR